MKNLPSNGFQRALGPIPARGLRPLLLRGSEAQAATTEPAGQPESPPAQRRPDTAEQSNKQPLKKQSKDKDLGAGESIRAVDSEAPEPKLQLPFEQEKMRDWVGGDWKQGRRKWDT